MKIEKQIHTLNELLQNQNILIANFDVLIEKLSSFSDSFDMMSIEEKRTALRILVDKVVWDGTHVHLYLVGQNQSKKRSHNERVANEILMMLRSKKESVERDFSL